MAKRFRCKDYEYEEMTMMNPAFPPQSLNDIRAAVFDDSDIIIATYPKCGTTWMQEIVYQAFHEGDFEGSDEVPLNKRYSFLEAADFDGNRELDEALAKQPPRLLKTHLSSQFYKKTLDQRKTKFIVVFRNPKDMLVSYYNFYKMADFDFEKDGTWEEFFDRFKKDKIVHGNYFDMQLSWWKLQDDPRILILKFEDMLLDSEKAIRQVAAHLNRDLSDDLVRKIVERTSFKSMKANPKLNYSSSEDMDHKVSSFMRKGQVGDWKNYFTEEQKRYVDIISNEKFESQGLFLKDE